jgi:hypothetical protein
VIKLHEGGRHTGNSLMHDAEVRQDIVMRQVGHASAEISQRHNHPLKQARRLPSRAASEPGGGRVEPCDSASGGDHGLQDDAASRFSGATVPLASPPTSDLRNPAAGK